MAEKPPTSRGQRGATGKTGATGATGRTGKQAVTPDAYLKKADELQVSLDGVRAEIAAQTKAIATANDNAAAAEGSANKSKWRSWVALVAAALALIGLLLAGGAIRAIITTRASGRVTACQSERRFQVNHNNLVAKDQGFISTLLTDAANDPDNRSKRDFILDYAKARVAEFDTTRLPVRKCDGPAIALFYKTKGAMGCEKTATNPKGKCLQPK